MKKIDSLFKKVKLSYFKHYSECGELTDYIIKNIIDDFDDFKFYVFLIFYSGADGISLSIDIEEDIKQNNKKNLFTFGAVVCNVEKIISLYKERKRKLTIKEILEETSS